MCEFASREFEQLDFQRQIQALNGEQIANSATSSGERFAASINCMTPDELRARIASEEFAEGGEALVESLIQTERSLRTRLDLVTSAIARLAIVSDVVAPLGGPDGEVG